MRQLTAERTPLVEAKENEIPDVSKYALVDALGASAGWINAIIISGVGLAV